MQKGDTLPRKILREYPALLPLARRIVAAKRAIAGRLAGAEASVAAASKNVPPSNYFPSSRAQRPIGIYFDELSRGINPFSMIETHGVADASDGAEKIAALFERFGLVIVRRAYAPETSRELNGQCISFSGLKPLDFRDVFSKRKKSFAGGAPVFKDQKFWSFAAHDLVRDVVSRVIGPNSFEFGSAVTAHYSARGLHRDFRQLVEKKGSAYCIEDPKKRIVRVLHYCGTSGGALGFIPYSNNETLFREQARRIGLSHPTAWFDRHREVLTNVKKSRNFVDADEIERHICWAHADPGDIIVSNSAMLHCGEFLTGPRYFFVSTYAESNAETLPFAVAGAKAATFERSAEYYRFLSERGFKGSDDILASILSPTPA